MNPELKQKWIEALESGKYKKGKAKLRRVDGSYCCLGVLCEVANPDADPKALWRPIAENSDAACAYYHASQLAATEYIPNDDAAKWFGDSLGEDTQESLARINDNNEDFKQVIKYIKDCFE